MLVAIGNGLTSLQDYSRNAEASKQKLKQVLGDTLDEFTCEYRDLTNSATIATEDDLVWLDETDPNGWPTVNLLANPSYEGTYSGGLAPSWAQSASYGAVTLSANSSGQYLGSECQQVTISNLANSTTWSLTQPITLPLDQTGNPIRSLPFYWSVYLYVSSAFSGATLYISMDWYDVNGTYLSSSASQTFPGAMSTSWTRVSVSGLAPSSARTVKPRIAISTTSGTNSGTLLIDAAQLEYATYGNSWVTDNQTALAAGKYPTPYCDSAQAGCTTDAVTGLYYRQYRLFGGYVRVIDEDYTRGPERILGIDAIEYGVVLAEAPANLVISAATDVAAIQQAVTYAQNQGYLAGIEASLYMTSLGTVDSMAFAWQSTKDVLAAVADVMVGYYYVDPHKHIHYGPMLAQTAPFTLSDQPDNVASFPYQQFKRKRDSTQSLTAPVIEGNPQTSGPQTFTANGTGSQVSFTLNAGNAIERIDSCTVGAATKQIGISNVNTSGYDGYVNLNTGVVTFNVAPGSGVLVTIVFRYPTPVIIRTHATAAEAATGTIRRKIHMHTKHTSISSITTAIARGKADIKQYSKHRPVITCTVMSPPAPATTAGLRTGQAIYFTNRAANFSATPLQIQEIDTMPLGYDPGSGRQVVKRDLTLGFYNPGAILQLAKARQAYALGDLATAAVNTILQDELDVSDDGWTLGDSLVGTSHNVGIWAPPNVSTWDGTSTWG